MASSNCFSSTPWRKPGCCLQGKRSLVPVLGVWSLFIIALVQCLCVAIFFAGEPSAVAASESSPLLGESGEPTRATSCEVVVTPSRNRFSPKRFFWRRRSKERRLVSAGYRVFGLTCFFLGRDGTALGNDMRLCHQTARSICGEAPLVSVIYEIAEAERRWVVPMLQRIVQNKFLAPSFSIFLFIGCQVTTPVDRKKDPCQGKKKLQYQNALFDSYQHATVYAGPEEVSPSSSYLDLAPAAGNILAGAGEISWQSDLELDCGSEYESVRWNLIEIRNARSPLVIRNDYRDPSFNWSMEQTSFPGKCKLTNPRPNEKVSFKYEKYRDYRKLPMESESHVFDVDGQVVFRRTPVQEIYPLRLPKKDVTDLVMLVHMRLLKFSRFPNTVKRRHHQKLKGGDKWITTIKCRTGVNVESIEKCRNKVRTEIEEADAVFVWSKKPEYLPKFLNTLVSQLQGTENANDVLNKYKLIVDGKFGTLQGVSPRNPQILDTPLVVDPMFHPLMTAPMELAFWESFSRMYYKLYKVVYDDKTYVCPGQLEIHSISPSWKFSDPVQTFGSHIVFLPFMQTAPEDKEVAGNNGMVTMQREGPVEDSNGSLKIFCFCPFSSHFLRPLISPEGPTVTVSELATLQLRSTLMYHVS